MLSIQSMQCWEIMKCSGSERCLARIRPETPCWEIAENLRTSQNEMNLCQDCIVYIVKTNDPVLTRKELDDIIQYRNLVTQSDNCPVCKGKPQKKADKPPHVHFDAKQNDQP